MDRIPTPRAKEKINLYDKKDTVCESFINIFIKKYPTSNAIINGNKSVKIASPIFVGKTYFQDNLITYNLEIFVAADPGLFPQK